MLAPTINRPILRRRLAASATTPSVTDRRTVQRGNPAEGDRHAWQRRAVQRHDGKWAWRIKAANGQVVATDGGQGYETKTHARNTLEKVINGHYQGPVKDLD
jgi:uncharacterized protein YegP (UPF0339 family)